MNKYDFVIIGAGIVGLTLARQIKLDYPSSKVAILEKEPKLGMHASGRNSGVLHSGIYYPENTLKAKLCTSGYQLLKEYCIDNRLSLNLCGKVVVCPNKSDTSALNLIYDRAKSNGVYVEKIDRRQLYELEPLARSATAHSLWVPGTAVFDPKEILHSLEIELKQKNVAFFYNTNARDIYPKESHIITNNMHKFNYGHLFNTAGLYADNIAKKFGLDNYTILPFKGLYYYLDDKSDLSIDKLIYPVPDLNLPFLGIHVTKNINGEVSVGPSAFPAFGRENYSKLQNIQPSDFLNISKSLLQQYIYNKNHFRNFAHQELANFLFKRIFINKVKSIAPKITSKKIGKKLKVGIRAQVLDINKQELVMDLLVKNQRNSTHILNAVSPAFTCSFAMAKYLVADLK